MELLVIGFGVFFLALGFVLTPGNARYVLAGYNMMSEEERAKIDIEGLVGYFRKFHLWFGLSFIAIGLLLNLLQSETVLGIFFGVYPIAAYIFLYRRLKQFRL